MISSRLGHDRSRFRGPVLQVTDRVTSGKVVVSRERTDWNIPSAP
ncbi:hypothetical protein [Planomonospora parontospora]|nr:hypothetical protein [Planomonospora parontospora]